MKSICPRNLIQYIDIQLAKSEIENVSSGNVKENKVEQVRKLCRIPKVLHRTNAYKSEKDIRTNFNSLSFK